MDFGTCFGASHWLSETVCLHSPGTLWFADLQGSVRDQMAARARADWVRFLHKRALELRSGGYLLVSTLGAVPDGSEINGLAASGRGIYRAMQIVAQEMVEDGRINAAVLHDFVFPIWPPVAGITRISRAPLPIRLCVANCSNRLRARVAMLMGWRRIFMAGWKHCAGTTPDDTLLKHGTLRWCCGRSN